MFVHLNIAASFSGNTNDAVFDSETDRLDLKRQYFLRHVARKQHGEMSAGLLKMAEKDNQTTAIPTKMFEFASISGIEGKLCSAYMVTILDGYAV